MTNLGPKSHTYRLAGEVFPLRLQDLGVGFATAAGKAGAVITAFFFHALLWSVSSDRLLPLLALTSLLGAQITGFYRIETRGMDMEKH